MNDMFYYCDNFNSKLSNWNVSNVELMGSMFYNCIKFKSILSNWNVSNVKYFDFIFDGCYIKEEYKPKFNNYIL
ncbi:MAG: hypothetical protein [Wendovervirus sonii]|uniref:BspA family leucine-rich repeat surface protein n=1 Tax=phage Lak_Megaphage_Sonny TaxID=3109229 RepID=A0ABZ0Z5C1_9CAUD|nr:MAG: hypothetical protein [phage Lak_Megaphage_Sonny]